MKPVADVNELFRHQRAIRSFTDEDVPDELVDQVLTAAIHAPSGSNTQPWHFIVIRDQSIKDAISEVYEEARATTYTSSLSSAGNARPTLSAAPVSLSPCEHTGIGSRRIPDRCFHLSECAESHAGRSRPGAWYSLDDAAPASQG